MRANYWGWPLAVLCLASGTANAATSICVEDDAKGYNWEDGSWSSVNYFPKQWLVRRHDVGSALARNCASRLAPAQSNLSKSQGCYSIVMVGEEVTEFSVNPCDELWFDEGDLPSHVFCQNGPTKFQYRPNGEIVIVWMYSVPGAVGPQPNDRDSLRMGVGKCSVIAP